MGGCTSSAWRHENCVERFGDLGNRGTKGKLMNLLFVLLFGLVVGVIARLLVPGREPGGWITSIVLGILGSFVGGWMGRLLGVSGEGQTAGFVMSVVGAVVLLLGYHFIVRTRASA